jgi:membrane protease YdiL (CAAX protease family)
MNDTPGPGGVPRRSGGPPAEASLWVAAGLALYPLTVWGLAFRFGLPLLDAAFLGALLAVLPTLAIAQIPLAAAARVERIPAYVASALTVVLLGGVAVWLGSRRSGLAELGLAPYPLQDWAVWSGGVLLAGAAVVWGAHRLRTSLGIRESPILDQLIPRTGREKAVFAALSLSAGFGEEIAFRGYALPLLMPFLGGGWGAALFTSAVFGLLHAYQGPLGMGRSALLGFLLASSFLITGSLWPAISAHVALDLLGGLVWGARLTR